MTASPRHHDSTLGLLENDPAQTGADGKVDGDVVGELNVSGPFGACHALPFRLLSVNTTKFLGQSQHHEQIDTSLARGSSDRYMETIKRTLGRFQSELQIETGKGRILN